MFQNCTSLKSVTFAGTTLETIPTYAFQNCSSLKEIIIPEGVTSIGTAAFSNCTALKKVVIPSTVETLTGGAFNGCSNLNDITVNGSHFVEKDGIIYTADGKTLVLCEKDAADIVKVPEGVTTIGERAFENCKNIRAVELPDIVTVI